VRRVLTIGGIVLLVPLVVALVYVLAVGVLVAGLIGLAYLWLWKQP